MALLHTDSVGRYGSSNDITNNWASRAASITLDATGSSRGGPAIKILGPGGAALKSNALRAAPDSRLLLAFRFKLTGGLPNTAVEFVSFLEDSELSTSGFARAALILNSDGSISWMGWGSSTAGVNIATNICDGNYHWIEIDLTVNANSTPLKVAVDGAVLYNATPNLNFGAPARLLNRIWFASSLNNVTYAKYIHDIIVWDDTGSGPGVLKAADFPLGSTTVQPIGPNGVGSSAQFAPTGAAANWDAVDDIGTDTANYVQSSTVGHRDLYALGDLSGSPVIKGVMHKMVATNPDSGLANLKAAMKNGVSVALGASKALPYAYKALQTPFPVDPNTGAAWTAAGLNAAEIGYEVA